MTDSNTRKRMRVKLQAFVLDNAKLAQEGEPPDIDGWLDDLMQTPELSLAELAESNPNYRLAVVDDCNKPDFSVVKGANGALHASGIALGQEAMWDNGYRRVVKMEER